MIQEKTVQSFQLVLTPGTRYFSFLYLLFFWLLDFFLRGGRVCTQATAHTKQQPSVPRKRSQGFVTAHFLNVNLSTTPDFSDPITNAVFFFYFGTKSYPVQCEHSFNVLCFRALIFGAFREFLCFHSLSSSGPITFSTNQCTRLRYFHTRSPLVFFSPRCKKLIGGLRNSYTSF